MALAHIKYKAQVVEDINMTDNFKLQTRDMLVSCLENHEYIDTALFDYADRLLDIDDDNNVEEAESLAWLISQYASYLDPRHCDPNRVIDTAEQTQLIVLRDIRDDLSLMLDEAFPEISFDPFMRIKTLRSYFRKIWREDSTPSIAKEKIRDLLAFRFLLNGTTPSEYALDCYLVHDSIIESLEHETDFKQVKTYTKDTAGFDIKNFPPQEIYVPSKDLIPECKHLLKAKDYIYTPKWNGYQGIQSSLYSPSLNVFLEVQVKTLIMHHNSDYFESSHDEVFKPETYEEFDYRRFNNLHGFHSRDGKIFTDRIGLFNPRRNF